MIYLTSMCQCPNIIVNNNFIYRETIKTAIENHRSIVVKGEYIPFAGKMISILSILKKFSIIVLLWVRIISKNIFLMSKNMLMLLKLDLMTHTVQLESMIEENVGNLRMCKKYDCNYILIENEYKVRYLVINYNW